MKDRNKEDRERDWLLLGLGGAVLVAIVFVLAVIGVFVAGVAT